MIETPEIVLPLVVGILAVALALATHRSHSGQDRAIRDIRADLDEAERLLEELGWAPGAPRAEEEQ